MKPAPFDYVPAASVAEAVDALGRHGDDAKILAGGQSLVPMLNLRLARPAMLVDINGAVELDYLREADGRVQIGAVRRQRAVERWAATRLPLMAEALRHVGHAAVRNRGTIAGSVAHGDPASELPALLLCLDGEVVARSAKGERVVPAGALYRAPLTTSLRANELVTEARFSVPRPDAGWGFAEVARRHGDFALVGAAALLWLDGSGRTAGVRLAFFGVGGTPKRGAAAEAALTGQAPTPERIREAARAAAAALRPEGDLHASARYRGEVAAVLAERTLGAALARCRRAA
jgi:aerobic carbon-monoxide dehydrogenase medium subunit